MRNHSVIDRRLDLVDSVALVVTWCAFLKDAFNSRIHVVITGVAAILGFALLVAIFLRAKLPKKLVLFWLLISIYSMFNMALIGSLKITNYIPMMFIYFPISVYLFYCNPDVDLWRKSYILYAIYIIYRMLNSTDGYMLFYSSSRNTLSALLLTWLIILQTIYLKHGMHISLIDISIYVVGCFISKSRAAIISAIILGLMFWLINIFEHDEKNRVKWIRVTTLFVAGLALAYMISINYSIIEANWLYRFTEEVSIRSTNARLNVWLFYFTEISRNAFLFLFGSDTMNLLPAAFNGNLHNSLLMEHAIFGILGFITVSIIQVQALSKAVYNRNYRYATIMMIYIIRSMTDWLYPAKICEIGLWLIILYQLNNNENIQSDK